MTIKLLWAREKGMGIIPSLLHINTIFADAIIVIYTRKVSVSEALCEDIERKLVSRGLNESHIRFIDTEMGALVVAVKTIAPMMVVKCCQTACANRRISSDCIAYAIRTKEGIYRHTRNDVMNHSLEVWNSGKECHLWFSDDYSMEPDFPGHIVFKPYFCKDGTPIKMYEKACAQRN